MDEMKNPLDVSGDEELMTPPAEGGTGDETPSLSLTELLAKVREFLTRCDLPSMLLVRLIAAYFLVSGVMVGVMSKKSIDPINNFREYVEGTSLGTVFLLVLIVAAVLTTASYLFHRCRAVDVAAAIGAVLYFDIVTLWRVNNLYLTIGVALVSLVLMAYALSKCHGIGWLNKLPWWVWALAGVGTAIVSTVFIAVATVHRHYVFGTGAHDFGLFVQMFHSLAENLTAVTSCERDTLMSHFDIHASYIFYLLVPFFKLFPYEETLLVAQAILAMGGIVPLLLIAKKRGFCGVSLFFVGAAYAFCAALIAPCFYEFHENAFLPTLLMWVLWACESKKLVPFYLFSALTCIVKEDAPLFIICIGLYWFFENKDNLYTRLHGLIAATVSGAYMVFITNWLFEHGDGQMMTSSRFGHLLLDPKGGFAEVVANTLADPAYFFSLLIEEETLTFFLQVMLPLLFLPFLTKKIHRFWLMMPFIITNLVIGANYGYAASIGYQYIFGPATLLLYMAVANVSELEPRLRNRAPVLLSAAALLFSVGTVSHRIDYVEQYREREMYFLVAEAFLDEIPADSVIGADAFYIPHISDRKEVYIFDYGDLSEDKASLREPERYDYVVLPLGGEINRDAAQPLEQAGYTVWRTLGDRMVVYQKGQ